ncbi:MAG: AraC family transcriptional regulator ligand-binding domain-containing protein [Pseudomonadota bacterium]
MSSLTIVITQYFARAAGFDLTSDGRLLSGGEELLKFKVENGRISARAHLDVLGLVAEKVPERAALSVRYAQSLDADQMGTLGLACKAAPDVAGVLQRVARYLTLLADNLRYHLDPRDQAIFLRQDLFEGSGPGLVFSPEAGLTGLFHLVRDMAVDHIAPDLVTFQHAPPRDAHLFEEFFGSEVRFNAQADGILLSQATLETKNKLGDQALSDFLTRHLDVELEKIASDPSLVKSTKQAIARALSEGLPKMADVARDLGFSVRSFHRRLADHGVSFQTLAEETRREIAFGMLSDEANSLAEIAFLTGFSEQSAFNRAFKRWTGQTPATYRKQIATP